MALVIALKILFLPLTRLAIAATDLVLSQPPLVSAVWVLGFLSAVHAATELLHWRARRRMSRSVQLVAVRSRREGTRRWCILAVVVCVVFAVRGALGRDPAAAAALLAVAVGLTSVVRRMPTPLPRPDLPGWREWVQRAARLAARPFSRTFA